MVNDEDAVLLERDGHVALLRLNNPPLNPIGEPIVTALDRHIAALGADRSIRAIVLIGGGGRAFSVGADLKETREDYAGSSFREVSERRIQLFSTIEHLNKPVIAAIRGLCLGGGFELALACHFRVAAEDARFGLPEIELGLAPAWGGAQRLMRIIGRSRALDILLRGQQVRIADARKWGIVDSLSTPGGLEEVAKELAAELAAKAPLAVAAILESLIANASLPLDEAIAREADAVAALGETADAQEGLAAFLEKREPVFRGE